MARKLTEEEKLARRKKKEKQRIEENLVRSLEDLRRGYLNEPTYLFNIGDQVQCGAILESIVTEVIDGGKIYKLHQICRGNRDNQYKNYEREMYVAWVSIRPYVTNHPSRVDSFTYEVEQYRRISYMNQSVESILCRYYGSYAGIDTEPDYQRELVWDLKEKVSLIDSIFKKIDIGKFTLIKRPYAKDEKSYEILDGKQRLNAIIEFYEDRFEYRGKTYTQLSGHDKGAFRNASTNVGETDYMTQKEKYEYFLRLNTGGKPQDSEHIEYVRGLLENGQ